MPLEEAVFWIRKMTKHSSATFTNELTHAGYKDIPVSYLFCEEDKCIPPKNQRIGIDLIERVSGSKVEVTSIKTDHVPNVSAPQLVVDWIVGVAEKA